MEARRTIYDRKVLFALGLILKKTLEEKNKLYETNLLLISQ
jgi:hypothetical protein